MIDASRERGEVERLILAHRKAAMVLQSVLIANGRRGSSTSATDEVNRAGEAMAQIERDLLAALAPIEMPDAVREKARMAIQRFLTDDGSAQGWMYESDGHAEADQILDALTAAGLVIADQETSVVVGGGADRV